MSKIEYPCFMESIEEGLVVCFSSEFEGHVILSGDTKWDKGDYSHGLYCADNSSIWKPYMPPLYEDGEVCWVWSGGDARLRRYDAINRTWCSYVGTRKFHTWEHHTKFRGKLPFELPEIKE